MIPTSLAWSLDGADGLPLLGDTHLPPAGVLARGVVLLCHGFKGYKDYGFLPRLAQHLAHAGCIVHRFNFSHSGMTNNLATYERPELFERDTWGKQIIDLQQVVKAIGKGDLLGADLPMAWIGHSRGGVTVLLTAARQAPAQRPAVVVTLACPDRACNLTDEQKRLLRKQGYIASPSSRTGQELRVGRRWLEEQEQHPEQFDPCAALEKLRCPVLVVHGEADETVPPAAAGRLAKAGGIHVELHLLADANHVFNAANPCPAGAPLPPATAALCERVTDFLNRRLPTEVE